MKGTPWMDGVDGITGKFNNFIINELFQCMLLFLLIVQNRMWNHAW